MWKILDPHDDEAPGILQNAYNTKLIFGILIVKQKITFITCLFLPRNRAVGCHPRHSFSVLGICGHSAGEVLSPLSQGMPLAPWTQHILQQKFLVTALTTTLRCDSGYPKPGPERQTWSSESLG